MPPRFPSSLEETISAYKSKYLIDLEIENEEDNPTSPSESAVSKRPRLDSNQDSGDDNDEDEDDNDDDDDEERARLAAPESDGSGNAGDNDEVTSHRGPKNRLPRDLSGLMGQANVSFARGDYNDAIVMCQEVIRLAPKCADPFISLAEYYNEADEEEKAEQLYLIAAYLQPSNSHLWVRVAESAAKRREFRLAATCYTKAIRADKQDSNIEFHLRRCDLYERLGDRKRALRGYENLISALGPNEEVFGLDLARGIARIYQAENKIDACIRTLESAFEKYLRQITPDDVTQLCQCYNAKQDYIKTVDLMIKRSYVSMKLNGRAWDADTFDKNMKSHIENSLSITLDKMRKVDFTNRCLLIVALISLGYHDDTIKALVNDLSSADVTSNRQSLHDVAKAYFSQGKYDKAKEILSKLTNQRDSQAASIWLLFSQCLKNLNEIDEAITGYRKVLSIEPDDYSSRLALSNLLNVQGRLGEALEVTMQPLFTDKPVDISLLFQRCQLLHEMKDYTGYCESAKALMMTDMCYVQHSKEIMSMITSRSFRTRLENLKAVQRELNLDISTNRQRSVGTKLDSSTMLELFLSFIRILYELKDYQELKRICFSAYTCTAFECYESSIDYYTAVACVCSADKEFTYNHLKILASRNPEHNQIWNMLSLVMSNVYQDLRHGRFCLRQFLKNPDVLPLAFFNGHNALMSGSYKHALEQYMDIYKDRPNDAFAAFCIALTFLSLSCQRYVSSKYLCLFQTVSFLHIYMELRGNCQEVMYNIGRMFHQMNMLDKAVIFYKKALSMRDSDKIERSEGDNYDEIYDLRREAAFNLALIYKNSQSHGLAYQVIKDNFII